MSDRLCVCCLRLGRLDARPVETPQVCQGCRSRLRGLLAELVDYYRQLDSRPGRSGGQRITGTHDDLLPVRVAPLDLAMPASVGAVHDELADQIGEPSVASVLDSWARDWQTQRPTWETLPEATVDALARWLSDRLEPACDSNDAMGDFAEEISDLAARVRAAAGLTRARPELKIGVPCRQCDRMALYRWPGSDRIECDTCPALMTLDEYQRWTELISQPEWREWLAKLARKQALAG